jgi:hypothetical protein
MVVLLVIALLACVALAVVAFRARAELGGAHARIGTLEVDLATTRQALTDSLRQHDETRANRDETAAELDAAQRQLATREGQLEASEAEVVMTRRRLDETTVAASAAESWAQSAEAELEALWSLELTRSERRWEHSVAPGPGAASPFADSNDLLRLAVETEASALREEVGTRISVDWQLDTEVGPVTALALLRLAQELMTTAAPRSEEIVLRVDGGERDVTVTLDAVDERDERVTTALASNHPAWRPVAAHVVRVVRRSTPSNLVAPRVS